MNDPEYVKQLESRIEELEAKLAKVEPQWARAKDKEQEKYFLFTGRCLLAMCYRNSVTDSWDGCIYNTLGAIDQTEDIPHVESLEEAQKWILKRVFCKRLFGVDL
jgi:hypothetical protein